MEYQLIADHFVLLGLISIAMRWVVRKVLGPPAVRGSSVRSTRFDSIRDPVVVA